MRTEEPDTKAPPNGETPSDVEHRNIWTHVTWLTNAFHDERASNRYWRGIFLTFHLGIVGLIVALMGIVLARGA